MITDLAHLALAAHDLDRSLEFYKKLGLKEAFRLNHSDGSLMLVYLHISGDRFIEIFPGGPKPDPERKGSFMHLCLQTEDIQAAVEQLKNAGVEILQPPSVGLDHNWQAWIQDPDGNPIELMQLSEESPQRAIARQAPGR